jgi:hypothetical protein
LCWRANQGNKERLICCETAHREGEGEGGGRGDGGIREKKIKRRKGSSMRTDRECVEGSFGMRGRLFWFAQKDKQNY